MKNAIVLLSGGLDSATTLALAQSQGFASHCLSFDYGQRHALELACARKIAGYFAVPEHKIAQFDLRQFGGSALTTDNIDVPDHSQTEPGVIPPTYVPARNTIFLACALAWAEVKQINDIFIGVNALDYSGYPDCRPEFIEAFTRMANLATKAGTAGQKLTIHTPLITLTKAEIIKKGISLGVDYALTISCYNPTAAGKACGSCDSCYLRRKGFSEAGLPDPADYL